MTHTHWVALPHPEFDDTDDWAADTLAEIAAIQKRMFELGLTEVKVLSGEEPDTVDTGMRIFAERKQN